MEKRYYIAIIKELRMNVEIFNYFEKVDLIKWISYYDTIQNAEDAILNYGDTYTNYTILTEYYITD